MGCCYVLLKYIQQFNKDQYIENTKQYNIYNEAAYVF